MRICKQTRNRHEAVTTRRAGAAILDTVTPAHQDRPAGPREGSVGQSVARSPRRDAFRDVLAVAPGLLPFGFALGIVIASSTMGDVAGVLGAPLVYGGSAQLTATTMFQHGAGLLAVVGSALIVNARLLLYSASLAPRFSGQPTWFRLTAPHFIIDQTYLSTVDRPGHHGRHFRTYWSSLGLGVMVVWSAAVGVGVLAGPRLPSLPHLALTGTALFVAMLVPRLSDRPSVAAAGTAAAIAPLAAQLVPSAGILVGTVAGMAAGLAARSGSSE